MTWLMVLLSQVHFIVAACENMISGTGMRPGDILTASNGKTIEVHLLQIYDKSFNLINSYRIEFEPSKKKKYKGVFGSWNLKELEWPIPLTKFQDPCLVH